MKKVFVLLCLMLPLHAFSQTEEERVEEMSSMTEKNEKEDSGKGTAVKTKKKGKVKKSDLDDISVKMDILNICQSYIASNFNAARYKMYRTENMNCLLKLDTFTGRMWQVQWSLDVEEEGVDAVNEESFANVKYARFELYPTKNIYQFILLDRETGRQWHVQWGLEPEKRWIRPIE